MSKSYRHPRGDTLISLERYRQIKEEGYTAEHDAKHGEDLAVAAVCYATPPRRRRWRTYGVPFEWPWDDQYWKPTPLNRVRELVKAGALIAAAIDALQAAEADHAE